MLTDHDKQATGNRDPANEINKEDPTQGILVWLQPITVSQEDLEAHVPAHSSGRENSDSEGDASKVETQKRKHSVHAYFRKKTKRDPFCEHKSMVTWWQQSTKSPTKDVNLGTITDTLSWYKFSPLKTSQETEMNLRKFLEPSQKRKVIHTFNLLEFGKDCEEIFMESSNNYNASIRDKRNCRTSCASNKRRDISRIIAIWIGW